MKKIKCPVCEKEMKTMEETAKKTVYLCESCLTKVEDTQSERRPNENK